MNTHKQTIGALSLMLLTTFSHGAFTWDLTTFSVDGGASITEDHTDNVAWPNPGPVFNTVGTGSTITGSFVVVGDHTGLTSAPGVDRTINFTITATGGNLDFILGAHTTNRFYALNFEPDANVTAINYEFTYANAIQGHDTHNPNTNGAVVVLGSFIDVDNASTFTQTIKDESLNPIDLNGDIWRTRDIGGGAWNAVNPSSYDAAGTALLNVSDTQELALGWIREDNVGTADQYVGQICGDLSSDDGAALGAGTQLQFTFNGDFADSAGVEVLIPEPTSTLLLSLAGLAAAARRKR